MAEPSPPPRILALDIGSRRIGLAITDPLGYTVQPLFTLHRTNPRADLKAIGRFLRRHSVAEVVVGNPLHMSGDVSPRALKSQQFAAEIHSAFGLPVHLSDERLTTAEAHRYLDERGGSRHQPSKDSRIDRTQIIDQVAAVLILEGFLAERAYKAAAAAIASPAPQ